MYFQCDLHLFENFLLTDDHLADFSNKCLLDSLETLDARSDVGCVYLRFSGGHAHELVLAGMILKFEEELLRRLESGCEFK